jgi:hypothetical protein
VALKQFFQIVIDFLVKRIFPFPSFLICRPLIPHVMHFLPIKSSEAEASARKGRKKRAFWTSTGY